MEKLTKQQIVLVTLLVSFVTSIATGIVTVALMDQAPPGVTQTINRVVERTIEKVVTEPANNNSAAVVTRETIVVKEDDKIVESVDKNKNSIVRIYTNNNNEESQQVFVGLGTIVSKEGLIVTGETFADQTGRYLVMVNGEEKFYEVSILPKVKDNNLYFLKIVQDKKNPMTFTPVTFGDSNGLKLGQTIIAWGGQNTNSVSTGIISSLGEAKVTGSEQATTTGAGEIIGLNTNISPTDSLSGGPLLNLSGEVVGLRVDLNISDKYNFLPSNLLRREVAAVLAL